MFPLSILTDEVSQDLGKVIRFAQEFRLPGIELRSLNGLAFKDLPVATLKEIRQRCDEAGLRISGVATPVFKCALGHKEDTAAHVEIFKRSVEAAQILGTEVIRVFTFLRQSNPATTEELKGAAAHFPQLLELVRGTSLIVGVENEASCIVATGCEMAEFLSYLPNVPNLGVVWDPCNVLFVDDAPDPVGECFPKIANRVVHVHVKDARREGTKAAKECVELGRGEVDFADQIAALEKLGYHGWVTLETHWRGDTKLDDESQHLPAGEAFSRNAEPASRICMQHLQRMLAQ